MNKNQLNGHLEECVIEIEELLKENGFSDGEIKDKCIREALKTGFTCHQVIEMMEASIYFKKVYLATQYTEIKGGGKGKLIPVCVIRSFVSQFLEDDFNSDQLIDSIERLIRVSYRDRKALRLPFGTHVSKVMKRSVEVAENHDIHNLDEFVEFLENRVDPVVTEIQNDAFTELECCKAS